MKKSLILIILFSFIITFSTFPISFIEDLNLEESLKLMKETITEINEKIENEEYFVIASKLIDLAVLFIRIDENKGNSRLVNDENKLLEEAVVSSFQGISACLDEEKEELKDLCKNIADIEKETIQPQIVMKDWI